MKKILMLLSLLCITIFIWGQSQERGQELIEKAQGGDVEAQSRLAYAYFHGIFGVTEDKTEAFRWAQKAAEQGSAEAQAVLGTCYHYGQGVREDTEKALYWYQKAADQSYISAYLGLGLIYEDIDKDKAIYWFKKYMDVSYQEDGIESEFTSERLRKLGVVYHPGGSSSSMASSSHSSSATRSSSSGNSERLLYEGTYTKSISGTSYACNVEIYDSHIVVGGQWCDYDGNSNGWNIYKYESRTTFGNTVSSSTYYYQVNPSNFEMSCYMVQFNPYTGGYDRFNGSMIKGDVSFDINQSNSNMYNGGYTGGYTGSSNNSGYGNGSSSSGSTSTPTNQRDCHICHGSGKCNTCNGTHRILNPLTNEYQACPNCGPDGLCRYCGGTGKKR